MCQKRDPVFENSKTGIEEENKTLARQIILGEWEWIYSQ